MIDMCDSMIGLKIIVFGLRKICLKVLYLFKIATVLLV